MKKSDITVSMPMIVYDEFEQYKTKYYDLLNELRNCFNTQLFDSNISNSIDFDINKAMEICKKALPIKYHDVSIECKFNK